jgi:predicted phage tail protein
MVNVKLHGILGEELGFSEWKLNAKSVSEAIRLIEMNTKRLYKLLLKNDKEGIKYKLIINGRNFKTEENLDIINSPENIKNISKTELIAKRGNLKTIDIVPLIEGAGDDLLGIFTIILGVVLIAVGLFASGLTGGLSASLVVAGIGLVAGGITSLMLRPPKFQDFREIDGATNRTSYLFNGPENVTNEGGPVPIVYGRLIVGSQVISASYKISNIAGEDNFNDLVPTTFNTNTKYYKTTIIENSALQIRMTRIL